VDVDEFSLGFGPILASRQWGKTLYSIRAVPLGGFCKPKGGDLSGETADKMYEKPPEPGEFLFASWWKRIFIFLAGPGMNYFSAFALFFVLFAVVGEMTPKAEPVLGFVPPKSFAEQAGLHRGDRLTQVEGEPVQNLYKGVDDISDKMSKNPSQGVVVTVERDGQSFKSKLQGDISKPDADLGIYPQSPSAIGAVAFSSPARKAGLKEGDVILSVNGQKAGDWGELHYLIEGSPSDEVHLEVSRDGKNYPIILKRIYDGMGKHIGITQVDQKYDVRKMGVTEAFAAALHKTADMTQLIVKSLGQLVTGKISLMDNLSGPVTIMRLMYQRASQGWDELFGIVAFISLSLCLMNLLPIPVVDGGQIVLCFIEGLKRKPVPVKIQMVYQQIGFFLVIGLMGLAVFNDLWSIFLEKFHSQIH
jgi:regulator of sigma E protease